MKDTLRKMADLGRLVTDILLLVLSFLGFILAIGFAVLFFLS